MATNIQYPEKKNAKKQRKKETNKQRKAITKWIATT